MLILATPISPQRGKLRPEPPQFGARGGRRSFRYAHGWLKDTLPAPSLNPTPPSLHKDAHTHTIFVAPLEEVPGSWADGPAGVSQQLEMLIEAVRGCVGVCA